MLASSFVDHLRPDGSWMRTRLSRSDAVGIQKWQDCLFVQFSKCLEVIVRIDKDRPKDRIDHICQELSSQLTHHNARIIELIRPRGIV